MPETKPVTSSPASPDRRGGILVYGMYDLARLNRAPEVRIARMAEALGRQTHTELISAGRFGRFRRAMGWLLRGGPRRVKAVYVESSTSTPMPTDLLFLALMRLLRRPVGVYFRDAYQLYRDIRPRSRRRQLLTDLIWRATLPLARGVASVRFAPSAGLATALHLRRPVLLPPGTDPSLPDLGAGDPDVIAAIAQPGQGSGLDTLIDAVGLVRVARPGVRLRVGMKSATDAAVAGLPGWVEVVATSRDNLAELVAPARVCVLPLPIDAYADLAVPVRLLDYLAMGKPVVATNLTETRAILRASQAGTVCADTAEAMAGAILPILSDQARAGRMAAHARRYACSPDATWDARAATVLASLGVGAE